MEEEADDALGTWSFMDDLPPEIVLSILAEFTDPATITVCRQVCKRWREILRLYVTWKTLPKYLCSQAAREGYIPLMKWAHSQGCRLDTLASREAAKGGQIKTLKWISKHDPPAFDTAALVEGAAEGGQMETLEWAFAQGYPPTQRTIAFAASGGHLDVIKLCVPKCQEGWDEASACAEAARGGHLEVLKWLKVEAGAWWNSKTCEFAAAEGHLHVLKYARYPTEPNVAQCAWDKYTSTCAAVNDHMKVLRWLYIHNCPWDGRVCDAAARNGNTEMLKWARARDCPWHSTVTLEAAKGGHLTTLKWAIAKGATWHRDVCYNAAANGHLAVLKWARENGCKWSWSECRAAATREGKEDVLEWVNTCDPPVEASNWRTTRQH